MDKRLFLKVLPLRAMVQHFRGKDESFVEVYLIFDCFLSSDHRHCALPVYCLPFDKEKGRETEIYLRFLEKSLEGAEMNTHLIFA